MSSSSSLPNPTNDRPRSELQGFDLHRAYRAMIREILRRRLLQPSVSSVKKEEANG